MITKEEILDYAIERINQYAKLEEGELSGACGMCDYVNGRCEICPFGGFEHRKALASCAHHSKTQLDFKGTDARQKGIGLEAHQKVLIERTTKWCKKYYPEVTLKRRKVE